MALQPYLPNIPADIAGGPPVGLADVRTTFSMTVKQLVDKLPSSVSTPLDKGGAKINTFLASIESKLPKWHPTPPPLPITMAGRRKMITDTGGVREVTPSQTALQTRVSGVAKQVANVFTSSGY